MYFCKTCRLSTLSALNGSFHVISRAGYGHQIMEPCSLMGKLHALTARKPLQLSIPTGSGKHSTVLQVLAATRHKE